MDNQEKNLYLLEIGNRIKQLRTERDMSQDELAKRCGYTSRSTINKIELGINDIPQSKIKAIAEALGVTVGEILSWDEMDEQHDTRKIQMQLKQTEFEEAIKKNYGDSALELLSLFSKLDLIDQARVIERAETLFQDEKYSVKKESSESKAM